MATLVVPALQPLLYFAGRLCFFFNKVVRLAAVKHAFQPFAQHAVDSGNRIFAKIEPIEADHRIAEALQYLLPLKIVFREVETPSLRIDHSTRDALGEMVLKAVVLKHQLMLPISNRHTDKEIDAIVGVTIRGVQLSQISPKLKIREDFAIAVEVAEGADRACVCFAEAVAILVNDDPGRDKHLVLERATARSVVVAPLAVSG